MNQTWRKAVALISLLIFPVTLNFFSPYVSVDGAFQGIVSGSVLLFGVMLVTATFFRRTWCSTICPNATLSDVLEGINAKRVNRVPLRWIRCGIFAVWFGVLVMGFALAGGVIKIDPWHLTESGISVDEPMKYITYFMVLGTLGLVTALVGKRGSCHAICWMSPFLVAGTWIGEKLHLPQYQIHSKPETCIACKRCTTVCPMSLDVHHELLAGKIQSSDCITCGRCVDVCPKAVLKAGFNR